MSMLDRQTPIRRHRLIDHELFFPGHVSMFKRLSTKRVRQHTRRIIIAELSHARDDFDTVVVDSPQPVTAVRLHRGLHAFLRR
jgi:hypothetical protein